MSEDVLNIPISDDILFVVVMNDYPELARELVALAVEKDMSEIPVNEVSKQKENKATIYSKGTRFDIYLANDNDIYDLEMQSYENIANNIVQRARYYASSNDVTELHPGNDYRNLKSLTIIFLCTFDPFKKGYAKYIVKERVFVHNKYRKRIKDITESIGYDCKITKIFFNASKNIREVNVKNGMKNVLKLIATNKAEDDFTRKMKETAEQVLRTKGDEIMTLEEKFKDRERMSETRKSIEIAKRMLDDGEQVEKVVKYTGLSIEQIKQIEKLK